MLCYWFLVPGCCAVVLLQAVRTSQSVLAKDRNTIINDFAPDKKVSMLGRVSGWLYTCCLRLLGVMVCAALQAWSTSARQASTCGDCASHAWLEKPQHAQAGHIAK